jgi:hypothetical protein
MAEIRCGSVVSISATDSYDFYSQARTYRVSDGDVEIEITLRRGGHLVTDPVGMLRSIFESVTAARVGPANDHVVTAGDSC